MRLGEIGRGLRELLAELRPDAVAMEEAFFGKNVQSTLALGEARGVALFVAAEHGLTVSGYAPATVKQAVVGPRPRDEGADRLTSCARSCRCGARPSRTPPTRSRSRSATPARASRGRRGGGRVIAFLRGGSSRTTGESVVVDVAGVGYQVLVSASTATALLLGGGGGETQLYVHHTS